VLRVPVEEERLHHALLAQIACNMHGFARHRVEAREVHRGRDGHRRRDEVLHLTRAHVAVLEPERELDRVVERRAGVTRDEVRNEVLLLAGLFARLAERLGEALVVLDGRLLHLVEHLGIAVLGRDR